MKKKIIIGIIITVILSLTAFGTVYAYQKETSKLENSIVQGKYNLGRHSGDPDEDCDEYAIQGDEDCLRSEERTMSNLRMREQNSLECEYESGEENRYQHRYEDQCSIREHSDREEDCEEDRQFKNQSSNSRNGR